MSNIGEQVENIALHGIDRALTSEERKEIVEYAAWFEECSHSRAELEAMDDKDLVEAAYWAMADYARGQM